MPKPIEYCAAARPISTGDSVDPMRPRLYEVATAVARMPAGKLSLKYVELIAYGAPYKKPNANRRTATFPGVAA